MHEFDKCVIASKSGASLASGSVIEFSADRFEITLNGEYTLKPGENINLFVYNSIKGECVFSARVEIVDGKSVVLSNAGFLRSAQKRDNTRVDKIMHYRITHKYVDGAAERLGKPIEITITNISANGMYIRCDEPFAEGHRFPFVFREAGKPISLDVEIIRCDRSRRGNGYGCLFLNIDPKDADNIYRFVLHEQIEQRRRKISYF